MQNFENFAKVKFRDILLTGTGHRDRHLNRDCPGQTGTYGGRSRYFDNTAKNYDKLPAFNIASCLRL